MTRNSNIAWGWPAIVLHWLGAAIIVVLLVHGWWMTHLAPRPERFANYSWHAALGYDFLALLIVRLLWRWMNPIPELPPDLRGWERSAAAVSHFGLYALMLLATLTGWAMAGTSRRPLDQELFGLHVPAIYASRDGAIHDLLEDTHKALSYLLAVLVIVHVLAALRHHFIKRNNILRRMSVGFKP